MGVRSSYVVEKRVFILHVFIHGLFHAVRGTVSVIFPPSAWNPRRNLTQEVH
jgi:hypothetical protein